MARRKGRPRRWPRPQKKARTDRKSLVKYVDLLHRGGRLLGAPATTSPPLTRRAASTAQSIRLLLRSDLVCVLWSVRGLGSGR